MAKGNRKRSNKSKPKPKKPNVEKPKTIYDEFPAKTLNNMDANRMKEIFTLSNNVAALIKDYAEKDIAIKSMRDMADTLEKEKQPITIQVAKNVFKTEKNYKEVADNIRKQAKDLEKSLVLIHGQIEHRYEDYVSTLVRHREMINGIINGAKNKVITGHRHGGKITREEEEVLFEKEFDKLTEDDKEQLKELDKKIKKAKKKSEK